MWAPIEATFTTDTTTTSTTAADAPATSTEQPAKSLQATRDSVMARFNAMKASPSLSQAVDDDEIASPVEGVGKPATVATPTQLDGSPNPSFDKLLDFSLTDVDLKTPTAAPATTNTTTSTAPAAGTMTTPSEEEEAVAIAKGQEAEADEKNKDVAVLQRPL